MRSASPAESLIKAILSTYTSKSVASLVEASRAHHPSFTFVDPFVEAAPKREALLQFLSLQRWVCAAATAAAASLLRGTHPAPTPLRPDLPCL